MISNSSGNYRVGFVYLSIGPPPCRLYHQDDGELCHRKSASRVVASIKIQAAAEAAAASVPAIHHQDDQNHHPQSLTGHRVAVSLLLRQRRRKKKRRLGERLWLVLPFVRRINSRNGGRRHLRRHRKLSRGSHPRRALAVAEFTVSLVRYDRHDVGPINRWTKQNLSPVAIAGGVGTAGGVRSPR